MSHLFPSNKLDEIPYYQNYIEILVHIQRIDLGETSRINDLQLLCILNKGHSIREGMVQRHREENKTLFFSFRMSTPSIWREQFKSCIYMASTHAIENQNLLPPKE